MKFIVRTSALSAALLLLAGSLLLDASANAAPGSAVGQVGATLAPTVAAPGMVKLPSGLTVSTDPSDRSSADEDAYRNEINQLTLTGEFTPANLQAMGLTLVSGPPPTTSGSSAVPPLAKTSVKRTSPYAQFRVHKLGCAIDNNGSNLNDMALPDPTFVLDGTSQNYILYATASYRWTNPLTASPAGSTCLLAVGGNDGFGLSFNKNVTPEGVSWEQCDSINYCSIGSNDLSANGNSGAGWAFQDYAATGEYGYGPTYKGSLTYGLRTDLTKCLYVYAEYGHTWDTTQLTGISIGDSSIGFTWSTTSNKWTDVSQSGSYGSGCN